MDRDAAHILTAKLFYALLRADAEAYLGVPITEAVATVPACASHAAQLLAC